VASYGQCQANLRDGRRCRVVIETAGAEFCPHHLRLVGEYGAQTVRKGAVPKRRSGSAVARAAAAAIITTGPELTPTAIASENILTVECPCCGVGSRVVDSVAEVSARFGAIELLLREALGRPPHVDEPCLPLKP
jgi:hypothetical protein